MTDNENRTTLEEASCCPRCGLPGEQVSDTPAGPEAKRGTRLLMIFCRTEGCQWKDTPWVVQINPDGSIPKPYEQLGAKRYPKLSPESETRVRESIEFQLQHETKPGLEIRNPRGN